MRDHGLSKPLIEALLTNRGPLRLMLLRRLGNEEDALDLLHDLFVRCAETTGQDAIDNPKSYLWRVAKNLATDRQRAVRRRDRVFTHDADAVASARTDWATPEEQAQVRSSLRALSATLHTLPANAQKAFVLSRRDGMDYKDIARVMGVSTNMVKKHIIRVLSELRLQRCVEN